MGQSLCQCYVHLTFSTKSRLPFIKNEIKEELHSYIAGTLKRLQSPAIIINSMPDHVHILFRLSKTSSIAKITEEVKKGSSKWIKTKIAATNGRRFSWQIGYGAFSVSPSQVHTVINYIKNQEKHHRKMNYREEVERFMKKSDTDD